MKKRVSVILMALIFLLGSLNFSTQSTSAASSTGNFEVTYDVQSSWDSESTFHCFLLLGQSNMAGYPKAQASDKVKDDRILVLGYEDNPSIGREKDKWGVACPPLHEAWNEAVGPGDWFAKTLINKVPNGDTIGLVHVLLVVKRLKHS